jgi:NADH-quinone oxidoreductase subunit C
MSEAPSQSAPLADLAAHIEGAMAGALSGHTLAQGELTLHAPADRIVSLLTFLRDDPRCLFTTLVDICGVDYPARVKRFDVVYHLLSMRKNHRIRVKVETDDSTPVASVSGLFPVADWFEREAFDMYGILFSGHPDLRRLLTDYGFEGYPLRKEFPVTGYVEVRYDPEQERVVYEPVKLTAAYRNFDFLSPWEGMQNVIPGDEKASKE